MTIVVSLWLALATAFSLAHGLRLELTLDLTAQHGPTGVYGICQKVFRVVRTPKDEAALYCKQFYHSRPARLEDLAEFYNLIWREKYNQSVSLLMADQFHDSYMKVEILAVEDRHWMMSELMKQAVPEHLLCVQTKKCPEVTTTSTTSTTTSTTTTTTEPPRILQKFPARPTLSREARSGPLSNLLRETEPETWVLCTIVLGAACLLLLMVVLLLALYACRLRNRYRRRKCYGACRFGCRCGPEVVRQAATESVICGPLNQPGGAQLTPRMHNGSFRGSLTYQQVGRPWTQGSNGKGQNPLYLSFSAADGMQAQQNQCLLQGNGMPANFDSATLNRSGWAMPQKLPASRRMSQEAIHRSTSDGSSVSGAGKTQMLTNGGVKLPSGYAPHFGTTTVSHNEGFMSSASPTRMLNTLDRRTLNRYFSNDNIDEVPVEEEQVGSNDRFMPNGKDQQTDQDLTSIQPPAGFFDTHNGSEAYSGMIGSTGTFLSAGQTIHTSSAGTAAAITPTSGSNGTVTINGGCWSDGSSPQGDGTMPVLPPRGRQASSNDSNDSGKSSGLRPSPMSASVTNASLCSGVVPVLPKLTGLYNATSGGLGPPIVSQAHAVNGHM